MLSIIPTPAVLDHPALDKPYRLTYELRPAYLYVHIRSDAVSYRIARQYWNEIIVMLARTRSKRLLVNRDIWAQPSVTDEFRMASEVAAEFKSVKLAICDRHDARKTVEFGALVATNRGLETKSFSDIDAAEKWLLAGDAQALAD